jgi:hypothetical protein
MRLLSNSSSRFFGPPLVPSSSSQGRLLLLTSTNRLGRAIDRARLLTVKRPGAGPGKQARISGQLEIL